MYAEKLEQVHVCRKCTIYCFLYLSEIRNRNGSEYAR